MCIIFELALPRTAESESYIDVIVMGAMRRELLMLIAIHKIHTCFDQFIHLLFFGLV